MSRVSAEQWQKWVNDTYGTESGRLFIQQLFRICLFWQTARNKVVQGISPQEMMAYDNVCKIILDGMNKTNIADLFDNTKKKGEQ